MILRLFSQDFCNPTFNRHKSSWIRENFKIYFFTDAGGEDGDKKEKSEDAEKAGEPAAAAAAAAPAEAEAS